MFERHDAGGHHETFNESNREEVKTDLLVWMNKGGHLKVLPRVGFGRAADSGKPDFSWSALPPSLLGERLNLSGRRAPDLQQAQRRLLVRRLREQA